MEGDERGRNEKGAERKGKNEKNGKGAVCKQSPQQGRHESRVNREAAVNSCDISFIRQVSAATDHERSPTTGNLKARAPRVERIGVEGGEGVRKHASSRRGGPGIAISGQNAALWCDLG